ncbi:TSUP family transporter [Aliikangiella sp. IMCC44359]|uniref:TSUP family transporter n=1 Tax=Aliikangiella sp. IMCC44359 TaxID=3459125 RepID=UPI00403AF859
MLILIVIIAFTASLLTFFSGFGLGTLLGPVFALFFPVQIAIASTAIVHLANNLFKLTLIFKHIRWELFLKFSIPAALAAIVGALLLIYLGKLPILLSYTLFTKQYDITPIKLTIGLVFIVFSYLELTNKMKSFQFDKKYLSLGGLISGFFGGLSGNQGAFRSAFLLKYNLNKESYIATGVISSCLVDIFRSFIYFLTLNSFQLSDYKQLDSAIYLAIFSALCGAIVGRKLLKKITMKKIQLIVAVMMMLIGSALSIGII